ncbi:zinc finger and BTB domain-containing protein 24-like [Culicoides brevitarsis]|uniref:zinc finger and BTB domain-containing protein 24-like n=1 Tax=Culicoides brevitarsis TaxID=469753 RepID=UPI00307C61B4
MTKDKTKKRKKIGPLFTKIPGAKDPRKQLVPELDKPICKEEDLLGIGVPDEPLIDLTDGEKVVVVEIKVEPEPIIEKKEQKPLIPIFRKAPPPVFKDGRWTDDDDEDEEETGVNEEPAKEVEEDQDPSFNSSSDSESSKDSFDEYFTDTKKKTKPRTKRKTDDDEDEIIPGFKKARESRHKYNYKESKGGPKTIFCSVCNNYFNQTPGHPQNFTNHILSTHATALEDEKFSCGICNNTLRDKKALKAHFNTHRALAKPKQCPTCGQTFTEYRKWRSHTHKDRSVASLPPEKRCFPCEMCGKICSTRPSLQAHILNIHQKKGRKCRWCPRLVPYDEWEEHKQMEKIKHNVNTNVTCEICGATFTSKDSAANHRRNFHRDRPELECDICHKTFKCSTYLSQHKTNTHGEKRFQCAYCHYRNSYKYLITHHIRKKHNMNPEDIPADAIIEHEQGSVPEREIREPVAKYGSKKKQKTEVIVQIQQPVQTIIQQLPQQQQQQQQQQIIITNTLPPNGVPIVTMQHQTMHHQTIDPHAAAMWAYAQRVQDVRNEHDQSSNSNY